MTARIAYNTSTAWGKVTSEMCDELVHGMGQATRMRASLYDMSYPDDWAALEQELGLAAGTGQEFFSLIDGLTQLSQDAKFKALSKIDQG